MKRRKKIILISTGLLIMIIIAIYLFYPKRAVNNLQTSSGPTINITYENFAQTMSKDSIIRNLPKDSEVLLRFYNFTGEKRVFERNFILKYDGILETNQSQSEVMILIHSKYLSGLTNKNLCSTLKRANQAGDLGIETSLSSISLAWKFKSMTKYKDCLV